MPVGSHEKAFFGSTHGGVAGPGANWATNDNGWNHEGPSIAWPGASSPTEGSHLL